MKFYKKRRNNYSNPLNRFRQTTKLYIVDLETHEIIDSYTNAKIANEVLHELNLGLNESHFYKEYFKKTDMNSYACYWSAVRDGLRKFITDFDLLYELVHAYEDELKNAFEDEVLENE